MKNKNIKDTFEFFSPTEERKERIYKSIMIRKNRKYNSVGLKHKVKLAYALFVCFVLVIIVVILQNSTNNSTRSLLEIDTAQYYQTNETTKTSSLPITTETKKIFTGFILTAYTANSDDKFLSSNFLEESEKLILKPNIKVLLVKYSLLMSSVPGLPFIVDIPKDDIYNLNIESINVSVDNGKLNRWNRKTGIVTSDGQLTTIDMGETIYWSPSFTDDSSIKRIKITIEAIANNTVIGRQNIYITQEEPGYYYAEIEELELF